MSQSPDNTNPHSVSGQFISTENTGITGSLTTALGNYLSYLSAAQNAAQVVRVFSQYSDATGSFVKMLRDYHYVPVIMGVDNKPVPVYQFIEVLDGVLDYDSVVEELPNLNFSLISGTISFLRKLAQYNPANIDIDRLEDEQLSDDHEFLKQLRTAIADEETSRVLASD